MMRLMLLITILAAFLSSGCGDSSSQKSGFAQAPPAVTVVRVQQREVHDYVEDVARTEATSRVQVRAQVTGIIKSRTFEEGKFVKEGDPLFQIDPAQFEADLAVATAAVAHASAAQEKAAHYLQRLKSMRTGAVSAVDMDAATSDAALADANLKQAEAQRSLVQLDLDRTQIKAPISGQIGGSSVDVGNLVTANGDALATIVQPDPIEVSWSISDRLFTSIKSATLARGKPLVIDERIVPTLILSNNEDYPHPGKIFFLDNEINPKTGTINIRARFPNPDRLLLPGQFVTVHVQLAEKQNRLLIPQASVQQDMQGYFVLVVKDDNSVEQRHVQLGNRLGSDWIVYQGVDQGDRIIFMGLEKVRPGITVNPVEDESSEPDMTGTSEQDLEEETEAAPERSQS